MNTKFIIERYVGIWIVEETFDSYEKAAEFVELDPDYKEEGERIRISQYKLVASVYPYK